MPTDPKHNQEKPTPPWRNCVRVAPQLEKLGFPPRTGEARKLEAEKIAAEGMPAWIPIWRDVNDHNDYIVDADAVDRLDVAQENDILVIRERKVRRQKEPEYDFYIRITDENGESYLSDIRWGYISNSDDVFAVIAEQNLNRALLRMTRERRRALYFNYVVANAGKSNRWIASELGIDHTTVGELFDKAVATGEIPHCLPRKARDGRVYNPKTKQFDSPPEEPEEPEQPEQAPAAAEPEQAPEQPQGSPTPEPAVANSEPAPGTANPVPSPSIVPPPQASEVPEASTTGEASPEQHEPEREAPAAEQPPAHAPALAPSVAPATELTEPLSDHHAMPADEAVAPSIVAETDDESRELADLLRAWNAARPSVRTKFMQRTGLYTGIPDFCRRAPVPPDAATAGSDPAAAETPH
jgi:hypothetical protein